MFFKTTEQQLQSNDCGIAAIHIIYNILGIHTSRDQIKQVLEPTKKGISLAQIKNFLSEDDFKVEYKLWKSTSDHFSNKDFPFILPIKGKKNDDYLVIKEQKREKFKIYDPRNGTTYFLKSKELESQITYSKTDENLIEQESYYETIIAKELEVYGINSEVILETNTIDNLANKLSYFKYIKETFGFKNEGSANNFLIDVLENQEGLIVPKEFQNLYFKKEKLNFKVPVVLTVKKPDQIYRKSNDIHKKENIYWKLFKQLKEHKKLWFIYIFVAFFSAFVTQLAVFINQLLIDHILPTYHMRTLVVFCIGLGIYQIFNIFTSTYKRFVGIHLKNQLDRFFLQKFDTKINSFSLQFIQSYKKGDLVERVSDSMKLKRFFSKFFINVFIDISISLYSLFILFFINWQLSLLILGVLIIFYAWFVFITPQLKHNERVRFNEKANFLSKVIEKIEAIQIIKSFGIEKKSSKKINKSIDSYLRIQLKNGYLNLINTTVVAVIVGFMSILIILLLSKYAIRTQSISLGQIITFIALSSKIFSAFKSILSQNLTLQENQIILKRFFDFEEKIQQNKTTEGISGFSINRLEVKNITFGYANTNIVLEDVSFAVEGNEKIQILGTNGSGKSTLSKIITALYKLEKGEIIINNTLSKFYDAKVLSSKILLSTNDDLLFNDTVLENICLGNKIAISEIISVSKKIGFYDFIATKDEGFDFMIVNNGKNVSTGQRKKILLLRAFFSSAEVLILDEVLSGIDTESRKAIETHINEDYRKYIIVSHEPVKNISFSKKYELTHGKLNIIQN
ncbi:ATP-binding cassette domain-containing protein [Tenacibaculum sp. 190524A02b]|uniref:ABC transporter transmembrane domain-containing protein n=1 Tax=Tenacibaculum vairaonense TaxID=3137860 RepID=UPI0032B24644